MSNEPETKLPSRGYVLSALLGIMSDRLGIAVMSVETFVEKYRVTPDERRLMAIAALHEKIAGGIDDSLATVRMSVDKFVHDEELSQDDVRKAACAIVRGALRNPDASTCHDLLASIAHAVGFLCGEGELIEVEGPYWSETGTSEYAEHLAWVYGLDPIIAGDLSICMYDERNHSDRMIEAPPELWKLMLETGAWKIMPSTIGDVRKVPDYVNFHDQLCGVARNEWREKFERACEELGDALKEEGRWGTLEEFNALPANTPLGPNSEARFAVVKQLVEEAKARMRK